MMISIITLCFLISTQKAVVYKSPCMKHTEVFTPRKVAYITAIYGGYESTCKPFISQTVASDFICFTDDATTTKANGWYIDTTPYHLLNRNPLDDGKLTNSLQNNCHPFNIAKYYKQSFHCIPRLKQYDVVIWLDGTIQITNPSTSELVLDICKNKGNIIVFEHEFRNGSLKKEVKSSSDKRYTSTYWNGHTQPYQDIGAQYDAYIKSGYTDDYWSNVYRSSRPNAGVWITCFVAFNMQDPLTIPFLQEWYYQTLKYTTQDQISFPYALFSLKITPYSLPANGIRGDKPHTKTDLYVKIDHGK